MLLERFKALSDTTRLRIYGVLLRHELNVNELVSVFGMGQSRISRHLKILTDCGLLKCRKDGLWSFYSADTQTAGDRWSALIQEAGYAESQADLQKAARAYHRRTEDTAKFFDAVAEDWERLKQDLLSGSGMEKRLEALVPKCSVVVDLGCGTGVLAILASKMGASKVIAIDNDEWAYQNACENVGKNGCKEITVIRGELSAAGTSEFDLIAANINRNVLLHDIPVCATLLRTGGCLLMSGFYEEDVAQITGAATHAGLTYCLQKTTDRWTAIKFRK